MKDFVVLKLLDRASGGLVRAGIDYPALRAILRIKLIMDGRRSLAIFTVLGKSKTGRPQEEASSRLSFYTLGFYLLISLVMLPFLYFKETMVGMSLLFTILMFIQGSTIITDFSSIMLDIRDRPILMTKPVDARTVGMAKFLHILYYLFTLTAALTVLPLIFMFSIKGAASGFIFMAAIILVTGLVLSLTAFVYYLVLFLWDGERLKDMINYVQILMAIGMMAGYQIMLRIFNLTTLGTGFQAQGWWMLLPPIWFATPFSLLQGQADKKLFTLTAFALLASLFAVLFYMRLMKRFEEQVQKLSFRGSGRVRRRTFQFTHLLGDWLIRDSQERAFYRFACAVMSKEREFKFKVYPSLGFALIIPFLLLLTQLRTSQEGLTELWGLAIYGTGLAIPPLLILLRYSSRHKAQWIYTASPIRDKGLIYRGAVLAGLIKLFIPVFLAVGVIFLVLFGAAYIPDFISAFFSLLLYVIICYVMLPKVMPFSEPFSSSNSGNQGISTFLLMLLLAAVAFIHVGVHRAGVSYGIWGYAALLAGINYVAWKYAFRAKGRAADHRKDSSSSFGA